MILRNTEGNLLVEDPDAVCKMAYTVPDNIDYARYGYTALHSLPVTFGLYDNRSEKSYGVQKLDANQIPQEEKYHWYYVGSAPITNGLRVYAHWSWELSVYLNKGIVGIVPKKGVYVSMKVTGPAYVKDQQVKITFI